MTAPAAPLAGRVALVTGASRGLGRHVAVECARAGADVTLLARTAREGGKLPGSLERTAAEVEALGRRALAIPCDVCDDEAAADAVERAVREWGRLDLLVNNAGVISLTSLLETSPRRLDLLWRVNVRAPFVLMRAALPHMIRGGGGHVVNVVSLSCQARGNRVPLGFPGYTATKAALLRLSQAAALELRAQRVAVNALAPSGLVPTEGWQVASEERHELPNREPPEYLGRAVVWIAAQDPSRLSGRFLESQQVLAGAGILAHAALGFDDLPQVDVASFGQDGGSR